MINRILICEDEKNIVSFLKAELAHTNYDSDVAYDGEEALKLFAEGKYSSRERKYIACFCKG